jgi:D-sedoheptulose 7-phosphate isomerase
MNHIQNLIERYPALAVCEQDVTAAVNLMIDTYRRGGKVLLCGNGGSAADCDHIAGELLKGFLSLRPVSDAAIPSPLRENLQGSLPAVSLPSLTAALTASLNDLDPSYAYAQLLYGLCKPGDVLIAISTSGNAQNVGHAATLARALGGKVLALTGEGGGKLAALADVTVRVPAKETYKIQEYHLPVYHALCAAVESALFD